MPNDRITSFECTYNLVNYGAAEEATFNSNTVKSFSNLSNLIDEPVEYSYMTLEHNYSVLNGSLTEFPDTFDTPYFSSTLSDDEGYYNTSPNLNITFIQPQNAYGLTFTFENDYPLEISVKWRDTQNNLYTSIVEPDNKKFVANIEFIDCMSIEIEFTKAIPYRYIKLLSIVFGQVFEWTENEINDGNLLLENDILSDKISINELSFKVIDDVDIYNLANDNALHRYFQKRQDAIAYEWVNGTRLYLGTYFLDNFSVQDNLVNIKCVSYMGLLDGISYNNGDIYNGTLAGTILEDIFEVAKIEDYLIDSETYNTQVYGTIKPMTCREALREVLFACGSTVNTTSEDGIVITKVNKIINDKIYRSNKISTKIARNDYIHGVEVEYANYKLLSEPEEIIKEQEYLAGDYTLVFSNAYTNIIITDSEDNIITPIEVKKYYCVFTLNSDVILTITGNKYEENLSTIQVSNTYIPSGESLTINKYSSSLCNAGMAKAKAKEILDYLQYRLSLDIQTITSDISMEGRKWIENPSKNYADFIAWYTSRSLNLTGGFIDTAKLVGYYYNDYEYHYAGNEVYIDEEIGVI